MKIKNLKKALITSFLLGSVFLVSAQTFKKEEIYSPNHQIKVSLFTNSSGVAYYQLYYKGQLLIDSSHLGLDIINRPLHDGFSSVEIKNNGIKNESYQIKNAKKYSINYQFQFYQVNFKGKEDLLMDVKLSDNGFAFRYCIPVVNNVPIMVINEYTTYHFPLTTKAFLQNVAVAKTGWENTNPSYEESYQQDIPVGTPEPTHTGWVYPALFHNDNNWVAISEAGIDGSYCATRLSPESTNGEYKVNFPDPREIRNQGHALLPYSDSSFQSPWRVVAIGGIDDIVTSTLGTDVAPEAKYSLELTKPGQSSWSWIMSKDDYIIYDEQVKYVDFAAKMHWKYTLVDADWDRKIGYEKIKELVDYASTKGVGILLWYNSAGDWNTVKYTPQNKLLTKESRETEFKKLHEIGVKGVKIDFFGGDGRSFMQYYVDILNDAAKYDLMVNFHGATLPRGWARTYPNLMTTEAVKGYENVTFTQEAADQEANLATILPFTRNLFDPMDWTPMNLYKLGSKVKRKTTSGFELATSILFLSGIQHMAESPEGMAHMPESVIALLQNLPGYWDDVRFIDGYPGKYVVIARKSGNKWFIAGINGQKEPVKIKIPTDLLNGKKSVTLYSDAPSPKYITATKYKIDSIITMTPEGGFVITAE